MDVQVSACDDLACIERSTFRRTCMRLILFYASIMLRPDVFMHIEVEERPTLAPRFCRYEIVEADVMRDDQVLFHIHQCADRRRPATQADVRGMTQKPCCEKLS